MMFYLNIGEQAVEDTIAKANTVAKLKKELVELQEEIKKYLCGWIIDMERYDVDVEFIDQTNGREWAGAGILVETFPKGGTRHSSGAHAFWCAKTSGDKHLEVLRKVYRDAARFNHVMYEMGTLKAKKIIASSTANDEGDWA